MNSIDTFKSASMITIEKRNTTIDFLKNELEEKNLHIRTLLLRDANDGRSIDIALLNKTTQSSMETTPPIPDENNFHDEIMVEFNSSQMHEEFEDNCQSIHSIISSISEESVISMERDSSNDKSNYSSNVNSNYSASEQLIVIDEFDDFDTNNNNDYDNKSLYSTWNSYPTIIDSLNETFVQHTTRKYELQPAKFCNNANDYINDDLQNLNDINDVYKNELDECALWRRGTTLIVGDKSRLKNCKVCVFPGASIEDMYYNIVPLIRKKPTTIILHAGANIEAIFVEINLRKTKWLLCGVYHPPDQNDDYFFDSLGVALDIYSDIYIKFLLMGDFNAQVGEPDIDTFLQDYDAKNIVKDNTCFKSIDNPSCVHLFITNYANSFQNTKVISSGLSDCHKMVVTVLKTTFHKSKPREIVYRDYSKFNEKTFNEILKDSLLGKNTLDYTVFEKIFLNVLNTYAPVKKKVVRANHMPYYDKSAMEGHHDKVSFGEKVL